MIMDHPIAQAIDECLKSQAKKALKVHSRVENAVLPVYYPIKREHRPEQIGSCVVVKVKKEFFIFTASHLFDDIKNKSLLVGIGSGRNIISLSGERFSSPFGESGTHKDDPIDATVFWIQEGLTKGLKKKAIKLKDLDLDPIQDRAALYIISGFRSKISNTSGKEANSRQDTICSVNISDTDYNGLNLLSNYHLAIAYDKESYINGLWKKNPKVRGFSGGAIIRITKFDPLKKNPIKEKEARQLLSAITIEQRDVKQKNTDIIVGTKMNVFLYLLNQLKPGLLSDNVLKKLQ